MKLLFEDEYLKEEDEIGELIDCITERIITQQLVLNKLLEYKKQRTIDYLEKRSN